MQNQFIPAYNLFFKSIRSGLIVVDERARRKGLPLFAEQYRWGIMPFLLLKDAQVVKDVFIIASINSFLHRFRLTVFD